MDTLYSVHANWRVVDDITISPSKSPPIALESMLRGEASCAAHVSRDLEILCLPLAVLFRTVSGQVAPRDLLCPHQFRSGVLELAEVSEPYRGFDPRVLVSSRRALTCPGLASTELVFALFQ